ncbi:Immunoglobulin V-set domain [Nesidiocoris tenuis]|uniref:Immunoglobulin V-set domain n=1 Tax=Nesidiocoris tenuis TaxID=355587 RepID=A0ABN7AM77_9HEMI|nr:Immunoglobulin V-set domain [Nesidiocoris tenuis]
MVVSKSWQTYYNESLLPRFAEPIPNVTVTVGRDALLACVVENLRGFKVAWVRVDTQTILSIHHNIITQNSRVTLSYNDHRSWYLHIKNVQEVDRGWYMCQINTDPMRSRQGYLQVVVPPSIVDKETSTDMVVREAANVTLTCKAQGYPEPYVMWRREDGEDINYNGESGEFNIELTHPHPIEDLPV